MKAMRSAKNINVYAVKTDAFHIAKKDVRKAKKALDFYDGVGGWRVETNKVEPILHKYSWRHNEIPKIPVYKSEREEVEDEWDTEAICKKKKNQKKEDAYPCLFRWFWKITYRQTL